MTAATNYDHSSGDGSKHSVGVHLVVGSPSSSGGGESGRSGALPAVVHVLIVTGKIPGPLMLLLLFHTFSVLVGNPKNYFTRWPIPLVVCCTGKKRKRKSLAAPPPPPPHLPPRCSFGEKIKVTRNIYMSRCYAGRRYAGLGPSRVVQRFLRLVG